MITFTFCGTSHGKGYTGIIKGLPIGKTFDVNFVNEQLQMRKCGYGRSNRQSLSDVVTFDNQVDSIVTIGDEVKFFVPNACVEQRADITAVRSGHADIVGQARYGISARQVAEISSARNSVCYCVLGAICQQLLSERGISVYFYTQSIGTITNDQEFVLGQTDKQQHFDKLHCPSSNATQQMITAIDYAKSTGNSLGGCVVVGAHGVPMGVGEVFPYASKLDAQISSQLMGIPSVKGISFGIGSNYSSLTGIDVAESLAVDNGKIVYTSNNCGGIVGGITTGQDVVCTLIVKPVPTVIGAQTIDTQTLQRVPQHYERADTCVVPNVGVIAQNVLAYVLLNQILLQESE